MLFRRQTGVDIVQRSRTKNEESRRLDAALPSADQPVRWPVSRSANHGRSAATVSIAERHGEQSRQYHLDAVKGTRRRSGPSTCWVPDDPGEALKGLHQIVRKFCQTQQSQQAVKDSSLRLL